MNDLKLLNAIETNLPFDGKPELTTFDSNMNLIYVSDHSKIYGISAENREVKPKSIE